MVYHDPGQRIVFRRNLLVNKLDKVNGPVEKVTLDQYIQSPGLTLSIDNVKMLKAY